MICRSRYNVTDSLRVPEQEFELRAPDAALEELVSFTFLDAPPDQPDWGWAHVSLLALARSGSVFGACTPASHPAPAENTIRYHWLRYRISFGRGRCRWCRPCAGGAQASAPSCPSAATFLRGCWPGWQPTQRSASSSVSARRRRRRKPPSRASLR
jgi:hypothetical protein